MEHRDRVAVVTGAANGIGEATTRLLLARDWAVIGLDLDGPALDRLHTELGRRFVPVDGDVTQRSDHIRARSAAESIGPLLGWVNNAGIERPTTARSLWTRPTCRPSSAVNLDRHACSAVPTAAEAMHGTGRGADRQPVQHPCPGRDFPSAFAYAATKGGINALTRQLAIEYAALGVRANAVLPGPVRTTMALTFRI